MSCCDFEDCDQHPEVALSDTQRMCKFHAAEAILTSLSGYDARIIMNLAGHGYMLNEKYKPNE